MSDSIDADQFTRMGSITKTYYRDVYPAIEPTKSEFSQTGKVTIITGAGKGIGRAIARSHAQSNVKGLVLITLSESSAEETKSIIQAEFPSIEILALPTNIADEKSVARTFEAIKEKFGTADTLINNAGVFAPGAPIVESDGATWWSDFEINVHGTYNVTAAFLRLIGQTPEIKPTVVNLISTIALTPPSLSSYFISKLSVAKMTEFVTAENPNVTAYSLSPGIVLTSMTLDSFKPFAKDSAELTGAVTVYLAAKRPEYLNGRHLSANWDLEELETRQSEFASSDKLKVGQFV
ncbi:oxidoreductase short chain dehydrogenase/reductase family [Penicillium concentricum]|uniref:Oxidoreductase short chain dehydrogenase/reductase family n=1 Tax=Penicillium concentricum TaxID=293559 RepID=A0A9W9VAB0_9EURO|nr:oxidoreductase short chain dehydrogenase/reductase family [Penicillium concentricum]KAJ5372041.1 oxidoreductase short chain dehydrogenase/reductase family [Penicillium concentricum]